MMGSDVATILFGERGVAGVRDSFSGAQLRDIYRDFFKSVRVSGGIFFDGNMDAVSWRRPIRRSCEETSSVAEGVSASGRVACGFEVGQGQDSGESSERELAKWYDLCGIKYIGSPEGDCGHEGRSVESSDESVGLSAADVSRSDVLELPSVVPSLRERGDKVGDDGALSADGGGRHAGSGGNRLGDAKCSIDSKRAQFVGPKNEKNKRRRESKKKLRASKRDACLDLPNWRATAVPIGDHATCEAQDILRASSVEKWTAQNRLATERARRDLAVLQGSDVQGEITKYQKKLVAETERHMVSIEKTHATLRATGNIPDSAGGSGVGFAETVCCSDSDGNVTSDLCASPGLCASGISGGTISPDSSASLVDLRRLAKENEDLKYTIGLIEKKTGVRAAVWAKLDKQVWTDTPENDEILGELYQDGYGKLFEEGLEDGKFIVC